MNNDWFYEYFINELKTIGSYSKCALPSAEEAGFGKSNAVYEHGISSTTLSITSSGSGTNGWKFKATEAFSIVGFRIGKGRIGTVYLWDSEGNERCTVSSGFTAGSDDWYYFYLDTPINIGIGEECTVGRKTSASSLFKGRTISKSYTSFNTAKLSDVSMMYASETRTYPTVGATSCWAVDIIIGPVQTGLPSVYQIQRTTMDDIAEEAQRISGATTKLTTAQIITELSEVETLQDYEGVVF